jgi:hypothetical protein
VGATIPDEPTTFGGRVINTRLNKEHRKLYSRQPNNGIVIIQEQAIIIEKVTIQHEVILIRGLGIIDVKLAVCWISSHWFENAAHRESVVFSIQADGQIGRIFIDAADDISGRTPKVRIDCARKICRHDQGLIGKIEANGEGSGDGF